MEKNNRTKVIDVQDQATGAWTTRRTAERRTILERLEERERRRASKLADQAYECYHAIVSLLEALELATTQVECPAADENLENYVDRCDHLLETLAAEIVSRDQAIIREVIATIVSKATELQDMMLGYRMRGVDVPTPSTDAPLSLPRARAWLIHWHEAIEAAERREAELLEQVERERRRLKGFLDDLTRKSTWQPEHAREFARDIEEFWRRGLLGAQELCEATDRIEVILEPVRVREDWQRRCDEREAATIRAEIERRQQVEERARRESTSRQLKPLIGFLRFMACEWEEELPPLSVPRKRPFERLPDGRRRRVKPPSRPTPFFWPPVPRCKRYEERLEQLAYRPTPKHQGLPKLAIAARKRKACHSDSQHYMKRLARGWAQEIDPRSEWRREYRELTGR